MTPSTIPLPADYFGFPDLTALQVAHAKLIKQQGETPLPADFLDQVDEFVLRAQATGRVLEDDDARISAQTVIDYWVTVLMRGRRTPPETGLAEYGFHAPVVSIRDRSAAEYLTDERVAIRKRLRLSAAAAQWNDSKRDRALLWGGPELTDAALYSDLTDLEREFIAASFAEKRRVTLVRRAVFTAAAIAACTILGLVIGGLILSTMAARKLAETQAQGRREIQHQLALNVLANATHLMRQGDVSGAFVWLDRAMREDSAAGRPDETHRIRIGAAMAQLPRLRLALLENDELLACQGARFSPGDGRTILTFSNTWSERGSMVRLWDAAEGRSLTEFPFPGRQVIEAGYCSGGRILTVVGDYNKGVGEASVWEPDGRRVSDLGELRGDMIAAALSPTGDRVALVYRQGKERRTFVEVRRIPDGLSLTGPIEWPGEVRQVVFSPDGNYFAACGSILRQQSGGRWRTFGQVEVWNAWTGAVSSIGNMLHEQPVNCASFSGDSLRLVTGSGDSNDSPATVEVWRIFTGQPVVGGAGEEYFADHLFSQEHDGRVHSVAFSPDDRMVLSASADETARLWDVEQGRLLQMFRHDNAVVHASFSPDGRYVVSGGRDQIVRVWKVSTGSLALPPFNHGRTILSVGFSPDGEELLTVTSEGARVWQRRTGEPFAPVLQLGDPVWQTAISRDGRRVVALSQSGIIGTWDAQTGIIEGDTEERYGLSKAEGAFFSEDTRLAVISFGTTAPIVETKANGGVRGRIKCPAPVTYSAFSRDNSRVLVAFGDLGAMDDATRLGSTQIRKVPAQGAASPTLSKDDSFTTLDTRGIVSYAAFSDDGRYVLTATGALSGLQGEARVWDTATGAPVTPALGHVQEVTFASFNREMTRVVTTSLDDTAIVWSIDLKAGTAVAASHLIGHSADLTRAIFSPDGTKVLTASFDRTAVLWDVVSGRQLAVLPQDARINDIAFSPDGRFVVTACADGRARVWEVATGEWVALFSHGGEVIRAFFSTAAAGELSVVTLSANAFGKNARAAVQVERLLKVQSWRLPSATESPEELRRLAELVRAYSIDDKGAFVRLSRPDFVKAYESVRGGLLKRFNHELPPLDPLSLVTECERSSEWFAARWHLTRLLAAKPGEAELLERRGVASTRLLDWQAALKDFQRASEVADPVPRIFIRQARADIALKRWDDAVLHTTHGLTRGGDPRSLIMLRAEAQAARGQWGDAALDLQEAIRLKPGLPSSYERFAAVRLKQGQPEEYRKIRADMLKRFANDEGLFATVAWAGSLQDVDVLDQQTLVSMATRAVADQPGSFYPLNTLGAAYYRAGRFKEAVDQLNESCATYKQAARIAEARGYAAAEVLPVENGRPVDWVFLAMAHHRLGHKDESQEFLKKTRDAMESKAVKDPRRTWHRIALEILLAEAEGLIRGSPPKP